MNTVKTYHKVDVHDDEKSFVISKMENIFQNRNGITDEPHRHEYYTVIVVKQAKGVHKIDFINYELGEHQIFFVSPGQVHQIIEEEKSIGYAMTFSAQFLIENSIPISFIEGLNLFRDYGQTPPLTPSENQFHQLTQYASEIDKLFHSDTMMKKLSIGAFLKLFLIACNNVCAASPLEIDAVNSINHTIRTFKDLVNKYYKAQHSAAFYANQMNVSADHLNRLIKSSIGKTVKEYIQSRITIEAKRLIYFSQLTNKEIGFELGFDEPANFSAFFKNCTGYSPSHFKQNEIFSKD